jgi:phosphomevalonate kinase
LKIEVSAPGKLVLIGEYGVLFGAPALVMAIDRRARVELTPAEGDRWILTAPGLTPRPIELGISPDGLLSWRDEALAGQYFDLVDRLLRELFCGNLVTPEGLGPAAAILDTRPFFRSGDRVRRKLGLGSSAALTVALASALVGWSAAGCVPAAGRRWLHTLVGLNRRVQGGLGSGIDIAASVLGGVIEYQIDDQGSVAKAAPMSLPGDLGLLCIWTGRSASTGSFLKRLEDRRGRDRRTVERAIDNVVDASRAGVDAIRTVSSSGFLDAVDQFWDVLEGLGRVIDMPIASEEHQRLRQLAADVGVRYKPSGAGGGDFGLAFDTDRERLAAMAARAEGGGFEVVGLGLDPVGVVCDFVET